MNGKMRLYDVTDVNYAEFWDGSFVLIGKGAANGKWVTYTGRKVFWETGTATMGASHHDRPIGAWQLIDRRAVIGSITGRRTRNLAE